MNVKSAMIYEKIYDKFAHNLPENSFLYKFIEERSFEALLNKECKEFAKERDYKNYTEDDIISITKQWKDLFFNLCYYLGFNKNAAEKFWYFIDETYDIWELVYKCWNDWDETYEQFFNKFKDKIFESSFNMNWNMYDLIECQTLYLIWINAGYNYKISWDYQS